MSEEQGYKCVCLICGGPCSSKDADEETMRRRMRSFSFGPKADEALFVVLAFVCEQHEEVSMVDCKRRWFNDIAQLQELPFGMELK